METRETVLQIMRNAPVVVLSTINGAGYPESRALMNLANAKQYPALTDKLLQDSGNVTVYLSTNTSSSKVAQVRANPRAALYYCIPEKYLGVWLSGEMEVVTDQEEKDRFWIDGWEMYYPKGRTDEDYCLLRMTAARMRLYRKLSTAELSGAGLRA